MLRSVDLPQPEWPMIETYSPFSIPRSTSRSTSVVRAAALEGDADVVDLQIGHVLAPLGRGAAGDHVADEGDERGRAGSRRRRRRRAPR